MRKILSSILSVILIFVLGVPVMAKGNENRGNTYPVILVHGFMGWGRDEVLGFKYWGGFRDLQGELNSNGYEVYTAPVGPVSSNWDRACELYAYIKGGQVDYGEEHAKKHGHNRFGRTFDGIYKDWGSIDENGNVKKIHLVGHSMGGQTIRVLDQLLSQGSESEKNFEQSNRSPLFDGNKHWICSVTTISTPHDGTTLADSNLLLPFAKELMASLGSVSGEFSRHVFDFKLDQWGLKREAGDLAVDYCKKVFNSNLWNNSKDTSAYDLTTDGAKELNEWVKTQKDEYYFAYTTKATKNLLISKKVIPGKRMNPALLLFANQMIDYKRNKSEQVIIDSNWEHNDGFVNCISQNGPKQGSTDEIVQFNGQAEKGKWNSMDVLDDMDHGDVVNIFNTFGGNILPEYTKLMNQLRNLPQ